MKRYLYLYIYTSDYYLDEFAQINFNISFSEGNSKYCNKCPENCQKSFAINTKHNDFNNIGRIVLDNSKVYKLRLILKLYIYIYIYIKNSGL